MIVILHAWLVSLVVGALVALFYRVRAKAPYGGNTERFKIFLITAAICYAVLYFSNSPCEHAYEPPPTDAVFDNIEMGEPNF